MEPTSAAVDEKARRYAALKQLYEALQQDHVDLSRRYATVKQKITHVSNENEFLVDELCRYTESDFDSDSDVGESSLDLPAKRFKVEMRAPAINDTALVKTEPAADQDMT
ncbi:Aste57867_14682 [Aphanomyces stellatus]|uniref:Aste57867_14682 protein n=1 Tax=Aphanomyces stellatus TaxID=120398 RepID=A0A485L298_9STRA|nr:hypothetical protein As57867_014627 [Aphanomyces stellatus]VFT91500.1 Aste57867_14682 [Aphanomyces stellatus]